MRGNVLGRIIDKGRDEMRVLALEIFYAGGEFVIEHQVAKATDKIAAVKVFAAEQIFSIEHIDASKLGPQVGRDSLLDQRGITGDRRGAWHNDRGGLAAERDALGKVRVEAQGESASEREGLGCVGFG